MVALWLLRAALRRLRAVFLLLRALFLACVRVFPFACTSAFFACGLSAFRMHSPQAHVQVPLIFVPSTASPTFALSQTTKNRPAWRSRFSHYK